MTITVNPSTLEKILEATFNGSNLNSYALPMVTSFVVFAGTQPPNTTDTNGLTQLTPTVTIPTGYFSPIANNTASLTTPLTFVPTANGTASFARFYTPGGALFDISLAAPNDGGVGKAIAQRLTCATGVSNAITDMKLIVGNNPNLRLSTSIANFFLERFINPTNRTDYDNEKLAAASKMNADTGNFDREVTVTAYKGTMPSADTIVTPDGVNTIQLWETTLIPDDLFSISGDTIALALPLNAAAYATQTPDYVTVVKAGYSGTNGPYPRCAIHAKVGDNVVFVPAAFTNNANAVLATLTFSFSGNP